MAIRFTCRALSDDETVLKVSPAALVRALEATNSMQRGIRQDKIDRLAKLPKLDACGYLLRVPIPRVGVCNGVLVFEDGRHRTRLAAQQRRRLSAAV